MKRKVYAAATLLIGSLMSVNAFATSVQVDGGYTAENPLVIDEEDDVVMIDGPGSAMYIGFSFEDISGYQFEFSSGAGAWSTDLNVYADGTFEGVYHDSDMGVTGDGYPNGTMYFCSFSGKFSEPVYVNDFTYSSYIEYMNIETATGTEENIDGIRYVYSEPYGLNDAGEILFYMPWAPLVDLPEPFVSWMPLWYADPKPAELEFYGIYNVNNEQGFSSYLMEEPEYVTYPVDIELADIEVQAGDMEARLYGGDLSQIEMNQLSWELYMLWDKEINKMWQDIKAVLDPDTMSWLTKEEVKWIQYKEKEIQAAGDEMKGGTMEPLLENTKGAELTKIRCYELAEYLRY